MCAHACIVGPCCPTTTLVYEAWGRVRACLCVSAPLGVAGRVRFVGPEVTRRRPAAAPCIFRLGSSVGGLIPCINSFFTFDAALLASIYTKSFGEPSPLGRRSPKPPTFEHVRITRARASRAGPEISAHVAQTRGHAYAEGRPSASTARPHSRASRPEPHIAARQLGAAWLGSSRPSHELRAGRVERGV